MFTLCALLNISKQCLLKFFPRGTPLIGKSVREFFSTKGFIRILDGSFLKTKGFLTKVYEIFGSEMPLGFSNVQTSLKQLPSNTIQETTENRIKIVYVKEFLYEYKQFRK